MFTIRNSQIEAMKIPLRKEKRDKMHLQLKANGYNVSDAKGRDLIIADSRGNQTRLVFDEKFKPKKIVKPSGLEYGFTFDKNDQLEKFSFPGNESMSFRYEGDLLKEIILDEGRIGLNYDDKGRITEVISQDGRGYKIAYGISGKPESITNRANETRRYYTSIKEDRHLIHSMTDSLGKVTRLETDPMGESGENIRFPDGTEQVTEYDEILDAQVTTLRNGARVVTYFDDMTPSRVEWEDGHFLDLELEGEQVNALHNPSGSNRFEYDDKGRVLSEEFQGNRVTYTYDEDGNLIEMVYPSGLVVRYGYDVDGRLDAITADQPICSYEYGSNDTVSTIRYGNGMVENRKEKVLGGLQASQLTDPSGVVQSQQVYHYDNVYRLSRYQDIDQSRPQPRKDWQFRYDEESRLLESAETASGKRENFAYDAKGNLINANGQPVTVGLMDEVLSIGGQGVQYDGNGNVRSFVDASGRAVSLTFNDNNELKFARIGEDTWEYWYDGLGRRVGKSNGKEAFKFFWGSEKLLAEEVKTTDGISLREYIYGTNATVPIAYRENGKLFWLQSDVRGAITKVFDIFAHAVWSADYSAFGEAIPYVKGVRQPWRLTGQYYDAETGLHYSTARYYSPHWKSFLSLDRYWLEYEASNYGYAGNDPYNKIDGDGNLPVLIGLAIPIIKMVAVVVGRHAAKEVLEVAVMAAASSVANNLVNGEEICWACARKAAKLGAKEALSPTNLALRLIPGKRGPKVKGIKAPPQGNIALSKRVKVRKKTREEIKQKQIAKGLFKKINGEIFLRDPNNKRKLIPNHPKIYPQVYPAGHPKAGQKHPKRGKRHPKAGEPAGDIGHKKKHKWSKYQNDRKNKNKNRKDVIEDQNNSDNYFFEDPPSNRGHKNE